MDEPVPVFKTIDDLYPLANLASQRERWDTLISHFKERFDQPPQFIARSPGRVNIIGEHIDYSLYEVLPMAIAADVLIAVSASPSPEDGNNDAVIPIVNINPSKHKSSEHSIPPAGEASIDATAHEWTNYFKAGFNGAISFLRKSNPNFSPCSMNVFVDGNVPAGGGLSSSAAFVCASALAVLRANGQTHVPKKELVELAIVSERAVGVNSGGMDQSASVFSAKGDALSVSFSPSLYAEAIPLPKIDPPITFMIAQSFVTSDKHVTAPHCYNLRVVECTLAAEMMAKALGLHLQPDSGPLGVSLRGLQHAYFSGSSSSSKDSNVSSTALGDPGTPYKNQLSKMLELVSSILDDPTHPNGFTHEEIASTLSVPTSTLETKFMTKFPVRTERFQLAKRARHVFSEALRVLAFKELLQSSPNPETNDLLT
ncbi:MAG: hypothetical protein Q9190_006863, partial [Brigantiaea leucoxantha]